MKKVLKISISIFFILVVLSSCSNEDTFINSSEESFYNSKDISLIQQKMGGIFSHLSNENVVRQNLTNKNVEIDFNNVNYKKSFVLLNFNNENGLNFYFLSQKNGNQFYFIQKNDITINVSDMVNMAYYEKRNNVNNKNYSVRLSETWGECYKRVKSQLVDLVEADGENLAICDGLNYLGLCDAAISAAAAAICTRDT